jgi:hypothetical protein
LDDELASFFLLDEDKLLDLASLDVPTSFSSEDSIFLEELLDSSSQSLQIEDEESTAAFSSGPLLEADEESSQAERAKNAANKKMVMSRPFGKLRDLGAMKFFIKHPRL